jgi:hypothetical protein
MSDEGKEEWRWIDEHIEHPTPRVAGDEVRILREGASRAATVQSIHLEADAAGGEAVPTYSVGEDPCKEGLSGLHSDESAASEFQGFDAQEDQVSAAAEAEAADETRLQKTGEDSSQGSVARRVAEERKGRG